MKTMNKFKNKAVLSYSSSHKRLFSVSSVFIIVCQNLVVFFIKGKSEMDGNIKNSRYEQDNSSYPGQKSLISRIKVVVNDRRKTGLWQKVTRCKRVLFRAWTSKTQLFSKPIWFWTRQPASWIQRVYIR